MSNVCQWVRGATPGVYKSACSLVPFIHQPEPSDGDECPFCADSVRMFGTKVEYDERGQVRAVSESEHG